MAKDSLKVSKSSSNDSIHTKKENLNSQFSYSPIQPKTDVNEAQDLSDYRQPQSRDIIANVMGNNLAIQAKSVIEASSMVKQMNDPPIVQRQTGLPEQIKTGVENLSGYSLDNVKVNYNSSKPAQLQALAYTQGTQIHVAPGQEKHLPHEAWHVVQQAQGRVQPTMQMKKGVAVNDEQGLEREADVMGAKALMNTTTNDKGNDHKVEISSSFNAPIQMVKPASKAEALNIAGTNTSNKKGKKLPAGMRFRGKHGGVELKEQLVEQGETMPDNLTFEECDVNTKIAGQDRDAERIIIGSDGRVWYTDQHYAKGSFVELK
jgi:guanyl-specific ribonuclease Sa